MVVTAGTFCTQSQKTFAKCSRSVCYILHPVLFIYDTAFLALQVVAVESCSQFLLLGSIRQHISCYLPEDKFIVRLIFSKGFNDPITPGPHISHTIVLITMRIRITRDIQPF